MYQDEEEEEHRNPELISQLWAEWVCIVCDRQKIPQPTPEEWVALKTTFHYDKAPVDSVADLIELRRRNETT